MKKIQKGIVEIMVLIPLAALFSAFWDGLLLKILVCVCLIISIAEIVFTRIDRDTSDSIAYSFYLIELVILLGTIYVVVDDKIDGTMLFYIICIIVAADVGAFLFQELSEQRFHALLRDFGIQRSYMRYLGAILLSIIIACIAGLILGLELDAKLAIFIVTAWIAAGFGDLISAIFMASFGVSSASETLIQLPGVGWIEIMFQSRGGYLGCFDTIAPAIIYYAILQQICAS